MINNTYDVDFAVLYKVKHIICPMTKTYGIYKIVKNAVYQNVHNTIWNKVWYNCNWCIANSFKSFHYNSIQQYKDNL
jgi:hypothetical protein